MLLLLLLPLVKANRDSLQSSDKLVDGLNGGNTDGSMSIHRKRSSGVF